MFFWERKLQCSEEISGLHDTELPDTWCVVENTTIIKRRNEALMRSPSALVLPTAATLNFGGVSYVCSRRRMFRKELRGYPNSTSVKALMLSRHIGGGHRSDRAA